MLSACGCDRSPPGGDSGTAGGSGLPQIRQTYLAYGAFQDVTDQCGKGTSTMKSTSPLEIEEGDEPALLVHGCRVPLVQEGGLMTAAGVACQPIPGSGAAELGLAQRVYKAVRVDEAAGSVLVAWGQATATGEDLCGVLDGALGANGGGGAEGSTFWYYEGDFLLEGEGDGWSVSTHGVGSGYVEERDDGSLFIQGYGCTLPGRTTSGDVRAVEGVDCRAELQDAWNLPVVTVDSYAFSADRFYLAGTMEHDDALFSFEQGSALVRVE